jgi:hypothetical protein
MTTSVNFEELAQATLAENRQRHADRMKELYKTTLPFEEDFFNGVLAEMSEAAFQGTGLSYELYVNKLSGAIDSYVSGLSEPVAKEFIALAKRNYDYATQDEISEHQEFLQESGFCPHGIELGCCPAGCGSY